MKILRIRANGINLFNDNVEIDFYAEQRVLAYDAESVYKLFKNIYTNNVMSVIGINASGKTSTLKLIGFVMDLLNGVSINTSSNISILNDSKNVDLEIVFYKEEKGVCLLKSKIIHVDDNNNIEGKYVFADEILYSKKVSSITSKRNIFDFNLNVFDKQRNNNEEYLPEDVSIILPVTKVDKLVIFNLTNTTNKNATSNVDLMVMDDLEIGKAIIRFFDPSIEELKYNKEAKDITLKFKNRKQIHISNASQLSNYLSSGTIKGINVFMRALIIIRVGGYLLIDELENHFNREIVSILIKLFNDDTVNKFGATLIFSTHYVELLDDFDRSDNIYLTDNQEGITLTKLSNIIKRNDLKKSDWFRSGVNVKTAPSYEAYIALKKGMFNHIGII